MKSLLYNNGWNPNGGNMKEYLYFKSYDNLNDLTCSKLTDSFTVDKANGNGALTYPVGLITKEEAALAYVLRNSPLGSNNTFWTLSPYYFNYSNSYNYRVAERGNYGGYLVSLGYGVRPAISLRAGIEYLSGDGTTDKPYVIDMSS